MRLAVASKGNRPVILASLAGEEMSLPALGGHVRQHSETFSAAPYANHTAHYIRRNV